jgi:hypothetical protein
VSEVVSGWTGIPVGRMLRDEINTVLQLQTLLAERVVGQSHALQAISRCPVLVPALDLALHALAQDPPQDGELELALGDGGEPRCTPLAADALALAGPRIALDAGGDRLEISPGVFFQAHAGLRGALREAALAAAGRGSLAADAFAGAGFFTLSLARRFERVLAIESDPAAAADLRRNAAAAGLTHVEVLPRASSRAWRALTMDVVLLDPAAHGPAARVAPRWPAGDAQRVVHVPRAPPRWPATCAAGGRRADSDASRLDFLRTPHVRRSRC